MKNRNVIIQGLIRFEESNMSQVYKSIPVKSSGITSFSQYRLRRDSLNWRWQIWQPCLEIVLNIPVYHAFREKDKLGNPIALLIA